MRSIFFTITFSKTIFKDSFMDDIVQKVGSQIQIRDIDQNFKTPLNDEHQRGLFFCSYFRKESGMNDSDFSGFIMPLEQVG